MKSFVYILRYLLYAVLVLLLGVMVTVQIPAVQTHAAHKVMAALEGKTGAKIELRSIWIKPFNTVVIRDVNIIDTIPICENAHDTLLHAGSIVARFSLGGLLTKSHTDIRIKKLVVKDVVFNFVVEKRYYRNNLARIFGIDPFKPKKKHSSDDLLRVDQILLKNGRFTLQNRTLDYKPAKTPEGVINWGELEIDDINVKGSKFLVSNGFFNVLLDHLDFHESTGWTVKDMSAKSIIGNSSVKFSDISLYDNDGSRLNMDVILRGDKYCFRQFADSVNFAVQFNDSKCTFKTLAHFAPLKERNSDCSLTIDGGINGFVRDIGLANLYLGLENGGFSTTVSGTISALTDIKKLQTKISLTNTCFNLSEISQMAKEISGKSLDFKKLGGSETYLANLNLAGNPDKLRLSLNLRPKLGEGYAALDVNMVNNNAGQGRKASYSMTGKVKSENLNLRTLLGIAVLGPASVSSNFRAKLPSKEEPLEAVLDSLNIANIEINNYCYHNINGKASIFGDDVEAELKVSDKALMADLAIWSDKYCYNGSLNLLHADLFRMNLDTRGESRVRMNIYGHLDKDFENPSCNVNISNLSMTNSTGTCRIPDIAVSAATKDKWYDILVESNVLSGFFKGNLKQLDMNLNTNDLSSLLNFALPGAYVEKGSSLCARIDSLGHIKGTLKSGRIAIKQNYLKDLTVDIDGRQDSLAATMTCSSINAATIILENNVLKANLSGKTVNLNYCFQNEGEQAAHANIDADLQLSEGKDFSIRMNPSFVFVNKGRWDITSGTFAKTGNSIDVDKLEILNGEKYIKADGSISEDENKDLTLAVKGLDLSAVNPFLGNKGLELHGTLDADGRLISKSKKGLPEFNLKLGTDSLSICNTFIGKLSGTTGYSTKTGLLKINLEDHIGWTKAMDINGHYDAGGKYLSLKASFDGFPFGYAQKFVAGVFSEMDGKVSGDFNVEGPLSHLNVSSRNAHFDDSMLRVKFTHVPYYLNGTFYVDNKGVHFEKVTAADSYGNPCLVTGGIKWDNLQNTEMDTHIAFTNAEAIHILEKDASLFHGQVFGTGTVDFTGPMKAVTMTAAWKTTHDSHINASISNSLNATKKELLTIVDPYSIEADPYDEMLSKIKKKDVKGPDFHLLMRVETDPQLVLHMDMGSSGLASKMDGRGSGVIDLETHKLDKSFKILGDYTFNEGIFSMNASNLVRRDFEIANGSSIKFGGDLLESIVDMKAKYQTKASIASLIGDTTSVSNRRIVECEIKIQDKLRNPQISFGLEIPDLEPAVKSRVESALSSEDKVQKQVLSLLLSNNFVPDEQSGIVNNSSLLYSNVSEIMANQINQIFNRLNIPLDLGLRYQPDERKGDIFDVAISTQLFNNRVIIGGTLGNKQGTSQANSGFFGDLDVQVKLDRKGQYRLNVFSHSADQYSNFLDNSQRNGVGVTWQNEFDHIGAMFRRMFSNKAKKEEIDAKEAIENKKTKTIILDE